MAVRDDCDGMLTLISARLDGMLSPQEEARLEAHLARCPDCRALARELEGLHEAMSGLSPAAPEDFAGRVMERVLADGPPRAGKRSLSRRLRVWGAAAALLLLAAGAFGLRPLFSSSPDRAAPAFGMAEKSGTAGAAPQADDAVRSFSAGESGAALPVADAARLIFRALALDAGLPAGPVAADGPSVFRAALGGESCTLTYTGLSGDGGRYLFTLRRSGGAVGNWAVDTRGGQLFQLP